MNKKTKTIDELLVYHQQEHKPKDSDYFALSIKSRNQRDFIIHEIDKHGIVLSLYVANEIADAINEKGAEAVITLLNALHKRLKHRFCWDIVKDYCKVFDVTFDYSD